MDKKERLKKQLDFIMEIDKVKNIFRQTYLADGKRKENDAEHSWHLALMAVLLKEYSNGGNYSAGNSAQTEYRRITVRLRTLDPANGWRARVRF